MKIELMESHHFAMKNTVIGAISKSRTVGDLVDNFSCLDFFISYEYNLGDRRVFHIYNGGFLDTDEYNKFMKYRGLSKIDLLNDHYDVSIIADSFESECFVKIKKY